MSRPWIHAAVAVCLLVGMGCEDDEDTNAPGDDSVQADTGVEADGGAGDAATADGGVEVDPLFVAGIRVRLPDGTTTASFLRTFASLQGVQEITLDDQAREFSGQRRFRTVPGGLFLENADEPRIIRFDRVPGMGLVEGPEISFSNFGFPAAGLTAVVSDDKAYNIDFFSLRIAVFDPEEMVLLSQNTLDLPAEELTQGFTTNGIQTAQAGNLLYIAVAFANIANPATATVDPGITVYIVNTETDTLVDTIVDDRCSHQNGVIQTENGDVYILGDNGFNVIVQDQACIVRINAGETAFDPDYLFEPAAQLGGRQTSDLVSIGGSLAVTFPLYPERLDPTDPTSVAFDPVRKPWLIDVVDQTAQEFVVGASMPPLEDPLFTRGAIAYRIGGETWFGLATSFDETVVYALDPDTALARALFPSEGQLISLLELP